MTRFAALLRGVNVGGHRKLPMADLRGVVESLGYGDVATYLQSGNVVLTASHDDGARLERELEHAIAEAFSIDTRVLARTGDDLASVITSNPFPDAVEEPKLLHVAFLSAHPSPEVLADLDPGVCAPDEFGLGPSAVYLRYATSPARSKLGPTVGRRLERAGIVLSARNWATVRALAEMVGTGPT